MFNTPKPWHSSKKMSHSWTIMNDLNAEEPPTMLNNNFPSHRDADPLLTKVMVTLEKMSTTEIKAPMFENATIENYLIFKVAFQTYKEKKGVQAMSELISKAAKTFLCTIYKIRKSEFDSLSDEELLPKLDAHFDISDTNNYKAII